MSFDVAQLFIGELTNGMSANGFEYTGDVKRFTVLTLTRKNGSAVEKNAGKVESGGGHEHSGEALVTTSESGERVHTLCVHNSFHRVGNHLTAYQRCAHTFVTHRDPIRNGDSYELKRPTARILHTLFGPFSQSIEGHIAGSYFVPA